MKIKLVAALANMDISRNELAKMLDVTTQTISNWCAGIGGPSIEQMRVISEYSGIPVDNIFLPRELS